MAEHRLAQVTPRNHDTNVETVPFIDLKSGYVRRSIDKFPKQGAKWPWRLYQNYLRDTILLRRGTLDDGALEFRPAPAPASDTAPPLAA
jgi:hypothetical protein